MAIIGAGVIGSEYACTFAAIGTEVHLIDGRHELLPYLDKEVSAALGKACNLSHDLGSGRHRPRIIISTPYRWDKHKDVLDAKSTGNVLLQNPIRLS